MSKDLGGSSTVRVFSCAVAVTSQLRFFFGDGLATCKSIVCCLAALPYKPTMSAAPTLAPTIDPELSSSRRTDGREKKEENKFRTLRHAGVPLPVIGRVQRLRPGINTGLHLRHGWAMPMSTPAQTRLLVVLHSNTLKMYRFRATDLQSCACVRLRVCPRDMRFGTAICRENA